MAEKERPLYTLYKGLKANNFDVPDNYDNFEKTLTEAGNGGANSRHTLYNSLKEQNFDVPDTYERFYSNLFTPVNKTTSRALGGSVPMSDADKARFSRNAAAISAQAGQTVQRFKNTQRASNIKQRQQKSQNDFGRVDLGTNKTAYGTDNAVRDEFGIDPATGKVGTYITSSGEEIGNEYEAGQQQQTEDKYNAAYNEAVEKGEISSAFDVVDKNGNYDLYENVGQNGTHVTEEGARKQLDAKIADATARLAEINARIKEIDARDGNPLLSYSASIGGGSGASDERRQLGLAKTQVEKELRSLDAIQKQPDRNLLQNMGQGFADTALTANAWDFGLNDFAVMGQMERIKSKVDNNIPLTNEEKRLAQSKLGADAAAALADDEMGNAYRWSGIAGQSVPFMFDFLVTGGFGGLTHAAGKAAVKYAAKKGMGTLGKNVLKYTGVTAANIVGSYAMAGTEQFAKTGADIMNRHMGTLYQDENGNYAFGTFDDNGNLIKDGGEGFGTALYKGLTAAMLENYTEKVFRHTHFKRAASKALSSHFPKFASFLATKGAPKWMKALGRDGLGEEIMEEEINIPLNALLVGDNKLSDLGDIKQQGDIIFGIGLSVGGMYALNAVPKGAAKVYNHAQYYRFKNKMDNVDNSLQQMMGDRWSEWKDRIDNTPNEEMGAVINDVLQQKQSGSLNEQEINTIGDYISNLAKVRGYNLAKATELDAKAATGEETTPEDERQQEQEQAYAEGQDAEGEEKHEIQMQTAEAEGNLASILGVSEEQLENMDLDSLLGENDQLDIAIYEYQNASARYQGVMDKAQSAVDAAEENARAEVQRRMDTSRGTVRNATIKSASNDMNGGEDYGVYIVSGNLVANEDGTINVSDSDDMILYFDPLSGKIEHGDASRFASLGEEVDAEQTIQQTAELARQDAIAGVTRDIDGKVGEGSQFVVIDNQGQQHVYEVLADNGDGTASVSIDGNVIEGAYPTFDELQKMKDDTDNMRVANSVATRQAEREQQQIAEQQQQQQAEQQVNFIDFSQLIDPEGTITTATIDGEEDKVAFVVGRTPSGKLRIAYLNDDGSVEKRKGLVSPDKVMQGEPIAVDEYKLMMGEQIAEHSTKAEVVDDYATKEVVDSGIVDENAAEQVADVAPAEEETTQASTFSDGTPIPLDKDGEADFSQMRPEQAVEWYDTNLGEDAQGVIDANVASTKKALDKAQNVAVKPSKPSEMVKARQEKQAAIDAAQTAYDNAVAVSNAYNELQLNRSLATPEGRKTLLDKAKAKYDRLKNKDEWKNNQQALWNDTVGNALHRLYDNSSVDVFDHEPQTLDEYVSNYLVPFSLNYEGTDTSKGVKQETGLERKDFAKSHVLAAEGKGKTVDDFVHQLWENRPSQFESATDQDVRNALIDLITSDMNAYDMRHVIENNRIAQAEKMLEDEKSAAENAAYQEEQSKNTPSEEASPSSVTAATEEQQTEEKPTETQSVEEQPEENTAEEQTTEEQQTAAPSDNLPFGEQLSENDLPFSPNDENQVVDSEERKKMVNKNKVTVDQVSEAFIPKKLQRGIARIAKMMPKIDGKPLKVQYLYSADADGWFDRDTNTLYLALDSSKALQMVFGHEMTHAIKSMNTSAYDELKGLVKELLGTDFDKAVDATEKFYNAHGVNYANKEDYEEEVIADGIGAIINDLNLTKGIALRMSHPLLAAFHDVLMKIRLAFRLSDDGTYERLTHAVKVIEKVYVDTAKGTFNDKQGENGEHVAFSLREKPEPKKKGIGYKVFLLKDGKLYPPMVANPNGAATPVGVWLDADAAPIAGESKTGRPQVKQGGKGTQGGSGKLAYRPGWHLGVIPYALQFNRKDAEGNKTLFPKNFVFAEVEYAADVDYQQEAHDAGINPSGKYQHSLAGLKHLPTDGYYMYRTNPNPETDPWVITGAMKVNRILTRAEQADLVKKAGREPQNIQDGGIVTDDAVASINNEIANAPKFSLKVYHGSGADFDEFDFDHMGEGAGSQAFGWGGYVTSSKKIGKSYAYIGFSNAFARNFAFKDINEIDERIKGVSSFKNIGTGDRKRLITEAEQYLKQGFNDYRGATPEEVISFVVADAESDGTQKEVVDILKSINVEDFYLGERNLYEVDIPKDNGKNYLEWYKKVSSDVLAKIGGVLDERGIMMSDATTNGDMKASEYLAKYKDDWYGRTLYTELVSDLGGQKEASKLLSDAGLTGIKYPAGTIMGGAEKGDTNYVIFDPKDMKIAAHTKFSIRTYHGSQASFDHFDHSFMGSGEGAQAYGWGTYVSEVEGIAKAYAKQNAKKHTPSKFTYKGEPMSFETPTTIYQVALDMDKYNITAKEAISKMIDDNEKKLSNVADTPFGQIRANQIQSILNLLKGLNPSDFNIEEDYDTIAQNLANTKSGLSLLEDELKDANSYVDLYSTRLEEAQKELAKAKESGTGLGVDMYESDVEYYKKQVEKYKENAKTKESDLEDVKAKVDALQKKLDSMEKPRNLYTVEIPDDTGENYIDWDGKVSDNAAMNIAKGLVKKDIDAAIDLFGKYGNFIVNDEVKKLHDRKDEIIKDKLSEKLGKAIAGYRGGAVYQDLSDILGGQKSTSLFLKDAGFDGVKVIAQRNTGGNKQGRMNYVIFDENNAKIVNHEKFSLRSEDFPSRLKSAISETDVNPSEAQKKSGNYKKGHIKFGGYDFTIENPKGSERKGVDADGKQWSVKMHDTYGYIRGKIGKDGDHLDMFINDSADLDRWNGNVYVVDQVNEDGSFDEHKVMYGYDSVDEAKKSYLANYSKGWKGLGNITGVDKETFDKWLDSSNRKTKPFADYSMIRNNDSDIRFSLAGLSGAATADKAEGVITRLANFNIALKMVKDGKDAKAIKMATGWEKGADGKWRYEMPDAKLSEYMDIDGKGTMVKRHEEDMLWTGGKLGDVVDAPELFKAYPQLKDVDLDTDSMTGDKPSNGSYNPNTKTITIHASELKYLNSILNHEIQHAIQQIEGFAKGGNPREFADTIEYVMSDLNQAVGGKLYDAGGVDNNPDSVFKALNQKTVYGTLLRDNDSNLQHVAEKYGYDNIFDLVEDIPNIKSSYQKYKAFGAYQVYQSLAGEVEARNVEKRMGMSAEERRNSLAEETEDVPRGEQRVRFSLKDPDKTMFGMHNISVDKLRKAIKQGGFAAPSMGVVDSKNGVYTDYGEITLIPKAEKLDKRKGKNAGTFTADAWTPTYPQVTMRQTKEGKEKLYTGTLWNDNIPKELGKNLLNRWESYINTGTSRPSEFAWQYMFEKGMNPKVNYSKSAYPKSISNKVMKLTDNGVKRMKELTKEENGELIKLYNAYLEKKGEGLDEKAVNEIIGYLEEWKENEKVGIFKDNIQRKIDYFKEFGGDINKAQEWAWKEVVPAAKSDGKVNHAMTLYYATIKADSDKKMQADLQKWFDGKLKEYGMEESLYNGETANGKPKYVPNTVENAVKIMKKQGLAGGYNDFAPGVGAFIAKYASTANTLAAMKKSKDKLIPFGDERHKEVRDMILYEYNTLARSLTIKPTDAFDDSGTYRMQELADVKPKNLKKYIADNWNKEVSDGWVERYNELVDTIKNNYPVFYFETKFMRPFGLDEFAKAIVPKDTPKDVLDALKNAGIDVHKYNDKKDREKVTMDAIKDRDDIMFSIRAYHGTGAKFDNFDLSHALEGEGSETFGHGVYVTNSGEVGADYAKRAKGKLSNNATFNVNMGSPLANDWFNYFYRMVGNEGFDDAKKYVLDEFDQDIKMYSSALEGLKADDRTRKRKEATLDEMKRLREQIANTKEEDLPDTPHSYRYDVEIPDDNGHNYLEWFAEPSKEVQERILEGFYDLPTSTLDRMAQKDASFRALIYDIVKNVDKKQAIPALVRSNTLTRKSMYDTTVMENNVGSMYRRFANWFGGADKVSDFLSSLGYTGIKYPAGTIHGNAKEGDYNYVIFNEKDAKIVGSTKFSLRYPDYEKALADWKKRNGLAKDAKRPEMPQQLPNESKFDFMKRVNKYLGEKALWNTAPTYEGHLLYSNEAVGYLNSELQRGSVLARIAVQDSMLPIRKAQEGIMRQLGLDKIGVGEDAYTAENRSHGKAKNEFEEYNQVYLQPLRKAYHTMKKTLGDSYDNVKVYMMSKHGLERNAVIAFRDALKKDFTTKEKGKKDVFDADGMQNAYNGYKSDLARIMNDANYAAGTIDYATYRQNDDAIRTKYAPSYPEFRYDDEGNLRDYAGLSALYSEAPDFEVAAAENVRDVENAHGAETSALWDATNAATKKILKDSYQAGMMSKGVYDYVREMYSNYIPLRGWDGTSADQVWNYVGGGRGAFNQAMKKAEGRKSIADDPIAYIENMAESGILLNNKNYVKQHLLLLAENHPTKLLTVSKAWYVKSKDAFGNDIWTIASPNIPADMTDPEKISQAIAQFDKDMRDLEAMEEATQKRGRLDIEYPQTHGEEREHEVRVLRDGEEYVIYVNGDPQLAQAMNNVRAQRVRENQSGVLDRSLAWLGRKMAAAYTSLSPLFIPANFTRDLTMTLASTAIREDGRYNYLLRKNFATNWNSLPLVMKYQSGKLRQKVKDGTATKTEQMFYDFMMNGGETGFVSTMEVEDFKKKIQNDLKDMDRVRVNPKRIGHAIMDSIELLNRAIEDSNRFLVYMTSIEYGRPIEEAVNNAKDVTLNFNRKGTGEYGWQMVRNLYLFINPAIQSLQTLGALAKHNPYKFTAVTSLWFASGVLVPAVNNLLLGMFGGDDDKDKYWSFSKWDRRNNFIMWIPFTKDFIKIPLAQEFRGFYSVGDMIASKLMGGDKATESWGDYAQDFLGQVVDMLPLDPTGYDGNVSVSLMPNAIRPFFELAFNVDFTGKPLFKDSEFNKYDPNFTKAYAGTPDWLVRTSRLVNSLGNPYPDVQQNAIDRFGNPRYNLNNPAVVDHVLSSYLGGAYTFGSQAVGVLTKALNSDSEIKTADIPLLSRFAANPDDRPVAKKQGDVFWNMKEHQDRTKNTLSKLKKEAKASGDFSTLEGFYQSEQYAKYKENEPKIKQYEEDKKKENAEKDGEEYKPHKTTGGDIYKRHATSDDDFEDMKMDLLWKKVSGFKTAYDGMVALGNRQSETYYRQHSAVIDAADEASTLRSSMNELKKGMLTDEGKDGYNAKDMKEIRELRKQVISILENAAKTIQKGK